MTLSALGLFAGAILMPALSPGPTAVALVARVVTHGGSSMLPFTLALWLGEALWPTTAILGLSVFLQQLDWAFAAVKWMGFLFLAFLAWQTWCAPPVGAGHPVPREPSTRRLFCTGLGEATRRSARVVSTTRLVSRCGAVAMGSAAIFVAWR